MLHSIHRIDASNMVVYPCPSSCLSTMVVREVEIVNAKLISEP